MIICAGCGNIIPQGSERGLCNIYLVAAMKREGKQKDADHHGRLRQIGLSIGKWYHEFKTSDEQARAYASQLREKDDEIDQLAKLLVANDVCPECGKATGTPDGYFNHVCKGRPDPPVALELPHELRYSDVPTDFLTIKRFSARIDDTPPAPEIRADVMAAFLETEVSSEEDIKNAIGALNPAEISFLRQLAKARGFPFPAGMK